MAVIRIYYFSGTGNSRRVAGWIRKAGEKQGLPVECMDISKNQRRHINRPEKDVIIGFCSPTHGFNLPPVMMHFLLFFPRGKNKVFIVNTRAGMKLSKFFLPGLSGMAQYFSALILLLKGYKVVGMRPVDLPSNWISLHPGLKNRVVDSLHERWERKTEHFAEKIISGKRDYRALYDLAQDLLVTPVAALYYLIGRFVIAKSFYADSSCTNCGICIRECPLHAIRETDKRPFWTFRCESCMHCMNNCPTRSIQTAHGYFIGAMFLSHSLILVLFWKYIALFFKLPSDHILWDFTDTLISGAITILTFLVTYRIFHYLLKVPVFREIIHYSSFTRFHFWRRYKYREQKDSEKPSGKIRILRTV
jgi:Pyruvate/2-oxoacid:ferredoxin oxidoreductase delta subunit